MTGTEKAAGYFSARRRQRTYSVGLINYASVLKRRNGRLGGLSIDVGAGVGTRPGK